MGRSPYLTYIQKSIAKQIKELREDLGLSVIEFADKLETSISQVQRMEDPKRTNVTLKTLAKLGRLQKRNVNITFDKK